jgi:hypothetical protein
MSTFVLFILAVIFYILFLLWCLAPLARAAKVRWFNWLRIALGVLVLCAVFLPPVVSPIILPIAVIDQAAAERVVAIALFPRTLPKYIANVRDHASAIATVVEISYPIEIAGVRYAPIVRTACTRRRLVSIDKGVEIRSFANYPTASGGELSARAGSAVIALDQSHNLCSMVLMERLEPGPLPDDRTRAGFAPAVYVIRGEAEQTQLYEFRYHTGIVAVDDIMLWPPEIVRVEQMPASDVVGLDALWPMDQRGEMSLRAPALIEAYGAAPGGG